MEQTEKMYHIGLSKEDTKGAGYVLMPGDPKRAGKIAAYFEDAHLLAENREYTSWIGTLSGEPVLAVSHGIGGPSTAIAVEELATLGVHTFIRVGTSGGMQMDVLPGDLVNVNGAIRAEGTSREYLPIEFPAISDFQVTKAIEEAAESFGFRTHIGVVHCKDSFYGQHSPERMPVAERLLEQWQAWIRGGALVSEMETAALFSVCRTLGVRAGAVMLCIWNQERQNAGFEDESVFDTDRAVQTAVDAMKRLIERDRMRK